MLKLTSRVQVQENISNDSHKDNHRPVTLTRPAMHYGKWWFQSDFGRSCFSSKHLKNDSAVNSGRLFGRQTVNNPFHHLKQARGSLTAPRCLISANSPAAKHRCIKMAFSRGFESPPADRSQSPSCRPKRTWRRSWSWLMLERCVIRHRNPLRNRIRVCSGGSSNPVSQLHIAVRRWRLRFSFRKVPELRSLQTW